MVFAKKELEIDVTDYLSTSLGTVSSDSGLSSTSRKRRRHSDDSSSDSSYDLKASVEALNTSGRTGRNIVIKPVDPATKCLTHATCRRITDAIRVAINRKFANLDYQEKRNFISTSVLCSQVQNERSGRYARKHSNEYHLYYSGDKLGEFQDFTVCRAMFISTIGITPWTMRNWLGENASLQQNSAKNSTTPKENKSSARTGRRSIKKEKLELAEKLEQNACKKFKSMLLARYLKETSHLN